MHDAIVECVKRNSVVLREAWRVGDLDPSIKANGTVISRMDARIEDEIRRVIAHVDPEAIIVGEELGSSEPSANRRDGHPLYVIDPIDGTHACTNGASSFAIVVERIASNREDVEAYIALPAFEELVRVDGRTATLSSGRRMSRLLDRRGRTFSANDQLLCDAKNHHDVDSRFPGKIRSFGSTAHHAVEVARGRYLAMLFPSLAPWDALPVLALMDAVRGSVAILGGRKVTIEDFLEGKLEGADAPILVAGHPSVLAQLPQYFPWRIPLRIS